MGEPLQAILFDLDGVIIDTRRATAAALATVATQTLDRPVAPAKAAPHVVLPPVLALEALGCPDAATAYDEFYDDALAAALGALYAFALVVRGIEQLHQAGVLLGVVTSQARRRLPWLLPARLHKVFTSVVAFEEAAPKPAPDGILKVLRQVSVAPEAALFVGDTPTDVAAAKSAGVRSAVVAWGFTEVPVLRRCGPDLVLDQPEAIGLELLALGHSRR